MDQNKLLLNWKNRVLSGTYHNNRSDYNTNEILISYKHMNNKLEGNYKYAYIIWQIYSNWQKHQNTQEIPNDTVTTLSDYYFKISTYNSCLWTLNLSLTLLDFC